MIDPTYVLLVPRAKRKEFRTILGKEDIAPVSWREKRSFGGSVFYLTGPATLVRETHRRLTTRLAAPDYLVEAQADL